MSQVKVSPSTLQGAVAIPPSKSDVHRAIICAALSKGVSTLFPVELSNDIKATISCIEALGGKTEYVNKKLTVDGSDMFKSKTATLNCIESGSTLRFFVPVTALGGVMPLLLAKADFQKDQLAFILTLYQKLVLPAKLKVVYHLK